MGLSLTLLLICCTLDGTELKGDKFNRALLSVLLKINAAIKCVKACLWPSYLTWL